MNALCRQEAVEGRRGKLEAASGTDISVPSIAKADQDKTVVSGSLKMAEKRENVITDFTAHAADIGHIR